jgi:hypothetical protein
VQDHLSFFTALASLDLCVLEALISLLLFSPGTGVAVESGLETVERGASKWVNPFKLVFYFHLLD